MTKNHSYREMGKTLVNNFYLDGFIVTLQVMPPALPKTDGKITSKKDFSLTFHSKFSPKVELEF